jgi:SNF2 family DNA or RNA helicase
MQSIALIDDELIELLKDEEARKSWLLLQEHPDFKGFWAVDSFSPSYYFDLKEIIGPYKVVSPANLEKFLQESKSCGYNVAFFEDPKKLIDQHLNDPPSFELHSPLENTINGLLPYQLQGFNSLKDLEGGVLLWSTGTGKTVCASALLKHHQIIESFDLGFVVVKSHNKINTQRMLKRLADIDSRVVSGDKKKRAKTWEELST